VRHPRLHLICNAHLDPVWQWRWEEGAAEAVATFRTAAALLGEHRAFIFNHNEAVLYRWVERLDPPLFRRIQDLAREGRWVISGGWYLQPDVNLPGLESLIMQIAVGRRYFWELVSPARRQPAGARITDHADRRGPALFLGEVPGPSARRL